METIKSIGLVDLPAFESAWVSTNTTALYGLAAIQNLALVGNQTTAHRPFYLERPRSPAPWWVTALSSTATSGCRLVEARTAGTARQRSSNT